MGWWTAPSERKDDGLKILERREECKNDEEDERSGDFYRLRDYEEKVLTLTETGDTLRGAWGEILLSSQMQVAELREKLDFARSRRDDARFKLREFRQRAKNEAQDLIDQLSAAKMKKAQLAFEIDQLRMKIQKEQQNNKYSSSSPLISSTTTVNVYDWPTEREGD
mmetsp:Transcript_21803/g.33520  ORF Transcript_21803/g.33520 Transcript_21803/m.33520 type:complete len:166 (-) Transcript_21803:914-1411(-)